jgi:pimeloyl-ACP methyl ester carboxylesterase
LSILHSNIIGDKGKDLLILHGFLGMGDNWKTHAKQWVSLGYRVHLIDQRNHGRSFWSKDFNYLILAQDVVAYCKHHQLEKVLILGHSMGGKTVMHLACRFPEYVHAFVVADIAPKTYSQHHQQILNGLSHLDFNQINTRSDADQALASYVKDAGTRMFLLKNLHWVSQGKLGLRLNIDVLKSVNDKIGEGLLPEDNSLHQCLFIKGEKSDYILENDTPIIKHHFPKAEQVTVPHAGHWLHAENPIFFFDTVTAWLQKR